MKDIKWKLKALFDYNENYIKRVWENYFKAISKWQDPWLTLVSCCDSRVKASLFIQDPINEVFKVNVIWNVIESALWSVDYWVLHLKTPVLIILWHSDCWAVKATLNDYYIVNDSIRDSLRPIMVGIEWANCDDVCWSVYNNINHQVMIANIRYRELIDSKKLFVIWAYYDLANDFDYWYWKLHFVNINWITDKDEIKKIVDEI